MKHLLLLLSLVLLPLVHSAELLENGDFGSGVAYWHLVRAPGYGEGNTVAVGKKELNLGNMEESHHWYLRLSQAVDLSQGKSYRLRFEAKGVPGTNFTVAAGDHVARQISGTRIDLTSTDWEPHSFDFSAKCDSDSTWFKATRKLDAKSIVGDGRTIFKKPIKGRPVVKNDSGIGACVVSFGLGMVNGDLSLRNVSLVPLP